MKRPLFLLPAIALLGLVAGSGAVSAQGYYDDDGPPPFHRGFGGPPPWDRWHHRRHWRDGDFDRRRGVREDREFGAGRARGEDFGRGVDRGRGPGADEGQRRRSPGGPRSYGSDDEN